MATLIPALSSCVSRMTSGERRLAERLEEKLDADYLVWFDVPVGPKHSHPDFVVLHPRRGLLILETKDWKLETIRQADKETWDILVDGGPKTVPSPLVQARHYAHQVVDALKRDPQLVEPSGRYQGGLAFPWSYGVVLTNISRKQFTSAQLDHVLEPHRVICSDEMLPSEDPETFQSALWGMFPHMMRGALSLPQIDRVRWIMFPQVRINPQPELFAGSEDLALPDIMRVMDLQQEQLARSLGDGHRVIHGVAGSGKTMILGYRAELLAQAATKPILILCYNEPLAAKLTSIMASKGLAEKVHVRHFHKWCRDQLVTYSQQLPNTEDREIYASELVDRLIRAVDRQQIPSGQYYAVMIDEGHDFAPEWLKLVVQMVSSETNSLLLLYDDAQSIYERSRTRKFTLKSVGINAVGKGRSTILKINYRNTRQILQVAKLIAGDLLTPEESTEEDGIPLLSPMTCGREGEAPLVVRLPSVRDEAARISDLLASANAEGFAWGDMAILCRAKWIGDECAKALSRRRLPHRVRSGSGTFDSAENTIKIMTMHVSKGLEFPVVALPGIGHMPAPSANEKDEARLFYVAATRATHKLFITLSGDGAFGQRIDVAHPKSP